jgi:predicted unusual protein kinase regulating ubiquinone biosynthesis (AarF/ABC1/UbiB family)
VGYVDFGITGFLSQYCRHNLLGMTLALARGDLEQMCVFFYRIATVGSDADLETFRKGLRVIADGWYQTQEGGRRLRCGITRVMLEMLQLSRRTHVWPDRDVIKFIRSAIAIDSLVRRVAPAFNVGVYLELGCERHVRAEMSQLLSRDDAFVDLFVGLEELACDGPMNIAATARRSTRRELRVREWRSSRPREPLPAAAQLAILFCASLLMVQHGADAEVGANLFTAAALVAAVSFGNFVWSAPPSR